MTVAFHAWNPFQIFQIANIARAYTDSVLLLEKRAMMDFDRVFDQSVLQDLGIPIVEVTAREIAERDGEYEAIVVQTPIRYFERLEKTKRVAMQYSMTKERHQHGAWRALCDLNLLYGEYSRKRCEPWAPCRVIGNPRFEPWFDGTLDQDKLRKMRESLDPSKKTVLYQPTWADLSSVPMYQNAVGDLSKAYNVIAKVHHNTDALELDRKTSLGASILGSIFGASDDSLYLLACADLVLSDYSGAIFDAINVGKPVVLLQHDPESLGREKFGLESIEYARRGEIGPVADTPESLRGTVDEAFANPNAYQEGNRVLKAECFTLERGCGAAGAEAIADLLNDRLEPRSYHQIYLRDELIAGRTAAETLRSRTNSSKSAPAKPGSWFQNSFVRKIEQNVMDAGDGRLPASFRLLQRLVPAEDVVKISKRLAANGKAESSLLLLERASSRKFGPGNSHLVTAAGRADDRSLLLTALKHYERMPALRRARFARNAIRISEALGIDDAGKRLTDAEEILIAHIEGSSTQKASAYASIRSLIQQRSLTKAEQLIEKLSAKDKAKATEQLGILKSRSGKWFGLIDLATQNAISGQQWCMKDGAILPIDQVTGQKVEFLVPTYFGNVVSGSDPETHARICEFLRAVLDDLERQGIAIVPKHQYWLQIANPTGNLPAISYHTTGNKDGWLHLKDAAIPGYFRIDTKGYAGFSAFADLTKLPDSALSTPAEDVERAWEEVQDAIIRRKVSKYDQTGTSEDLPKPGYIFVALQLLDDTVSKLAWIPMLTGLQVVVDEANKAGKSVVIKRHPMCKRQDVADALALYGNADGVTVTDASIHDAIPNAETIVTVNSGVGFEALLYGKPVITLGAAEYGVVTKQCRTPAELAQALRSPSPADVDSVKRFVWLYLSNSVRTDNVGKIADWVLSSHQ